MKPGHEISSMEVLLDGLAKLWSPGGEALKLQKDLNVRSLEETKAAAEQAGCTVCYVDLPTRVSGFAEMIEGKPHIVLNRAKSRQNLEYTLPHELGHYVLHLNPSRDVGPSGFPDVGTAEFQAHLFAYTWIISLGNDRQRTGALAESPESSASVAVCLILTLALAVIVTLIAVYSRLFPLQRSVLTEAK